MGRPKGSKNRPKDPPRAAVRADDWYSILAGVNTARDKRTSFDHQVVPLLREECEDLWRGSDMAARMVEKEPEEMLRAGFDLKIQDGDGPAPKKKPEPGEDSSAPKSDRAREDAFPPPGGAAPLIPPMPKKPPGEIEPPDDDSRQMSEDTMSALRDLKFHERFYEALCYERAFGGAGLLIGADDKQADLSKPLNEDNVQEVLFLNVFLPREMYPVQWYADPSKPNFGQPEIYRVQPETLPQASVSTSAGMGVTTSSGTLASAGKNVTYQFVEIHESRFLVFPGIVTSRRQVRTNNGWGDSIFVKSRTVLRDFDIAYQSAGALVADFAQAVFKIKDLANLIATDQDEVVKKRMALMDMMRSTIRGVLIDADEDFERKPTPMSGLPEILEKFALRLAACADMPVSLLMGQAPAGLNATGASDIRFWYDRISARQKTKLEPLIKRLIRIVMRAKNGPTKGVEPENWSLQFAKLWQLSEAEAATARFQQAQADALYITNQVLTPEEVAASRFGGDEYSTETHLDLDTRTEMADQFESDQADALDAQKKAAEAAAKDPPPMVAKPAPTAKK